MRLNYCSVAKDLLQFVVWLCAFAELGGYGGAKSFLSGGGNREISGVKLGFGALNTEGG